jgi:hypothetical protein
MLFRQPVKMRNPVPLISFTFDDFPRSALHTGGAILSRHGFVGTYYAALGLMNQDSPVGDIFCAEDLREVLSSGHELGCHTFRHCDAWNTRPHVFENSIVENQRALRKLMPDTRFTTMSYPISGPRPRTKSKAVKHFNCCRSGGQTFNVGTVDRGSLRAFFLEQSRDNPARVKQIIDRNCEQRGWLIFATHDISEQPSRFGCTPALFEEVVRYAAASSAKVLPVAKAWDVVCAPGC